MRSFLLALCTFLLISSGAFAQHPMYYRVQLITNEKGLHRLSTSGVTIDHGEIKKGSSFISDFSADELKIIKRSGISYKILISDVSSYYEKRNKISQATEQTASNSTADASITTCPVYTTPANFKLGTMGGFYKYAEMLAVLDSMAKKYPNLITTKKLVSSTQTTAQGRPLYYVKISDNPNTDETEPKILYTALHHAREPESLSQLIFFMWYVLEKYNTDPFVKSLVDSTEMYFIPCVNPDGYMYNQTTNPNGGGLWRKNRKSNGNGTYGVDINRNYGYKWGYDNVGSSNSTSSDAYRGPSAFSEPETQMIRNFCNSRTFTFALNHHTYGNYVIYPYNYKSNTYTPDSILLKQDGTQLARCNGFKTGTAFQTVGYTANGDSNDWMYGEQTTKSKIFSFTAETGTSTDGFWPASSRIIPIAQSNMDMNLTAARLTKESATGIATIATTAKISSAVQDVKSAVSYLYNAPNPGSNYTYINYNLNKNISANLELNIFDASGTQIRSIKLNRNETRVFVNTASLKAGIYYYSISDGKSNSAVAKLVIIK